MPESPRDPDLRGSASFVASLGDTLRRARYRRSPLRQISPVHVGSSGADARFQWSPSVRLEGRAHDALMCSPNACVAYEVVLPSNASVRSWCALAPAPAGGETVEFEIRVRVADFDSSVRRHIAAGPQQRWQPITVTARDAGPARIELATRVVHGAPDDRLTALWGDPSIRTPRPLTDFLTAARSAVSQWGVRGLWQRVLPADGDRLYSLWTRESEPSRAALRAQRAQSSAAGRVFTLITFVADPGAWDSGPTASSILAQSYSRWEWILVARESSFPSVRSTAANLGDNRVRVEAVPENATRADAWNAGLRASRGEYVGLVGERDGLSPSALYEIASALDGAQDTDVVYCDEDRLDVSGSRRHHPHFKPDWSPDYLASCNYIGRLALMRISTVQAVGGFVDRASDEEWELLLRLSRAKARVRRLPRCLYHRHDEGLPAEDISAAAVRSAHRDAIGIPDSRPSAHPLVSIVIPNRNAAAVLRTCVTGLVNETAYPHREIVIVDNGSTDAEVLEIYESLQQGGHGRIVAFNRPFNFSAACNAGAAAARGELLLFLNNDIEVIHPEWLDELVQWAVRPEIGIVGAQLLYPDRTIQHAGVVFGIGLVGHIFARATPDTSGIFGSAADCRNYLAVTGACQIMRRDVFDRLGGYDERFRLSFSDVILCMEAWKAGWRVVYTPDARLVHHESYTRKRDDSAEDMELLARYLKETGFTEDPYFHPELDPKSPIPAIRPPLDPMPRQIISDYVERVLAAATT